MSLLEPNKNANSPNARNSTQVGFEQGVAIGSMFGPAGAAVGAFVGAGLGALQGNGSRNRARREATDASYSFAKDIFTYSGETRSQIATEYERNLSTLTAVSASRGASSPGAFDVSKGKLIQERDVALGSIDEEVQSYRQGPNYEWFRNDYELVTGVGTSGNRRSKGRESTLRLTLGTNQSRSSRDLPNPYSPEQLARMYTSADASGERQEYSNEAAAFREYANRVRPSLEQYERLVFGNDEDRAAYNDYMDARITSANTWYAARRAVSAVQNTQLEERRAFLDSRP